MPIFDTLFNDHAAPALTDVFGTSVIAWSAGDEMVTAIELPSGKSVTNAMFHEHAAEKVENDGMLSNVIKARLWVPISFKPTQRSSWKITRSDGTITDFTCTAFGERSGGFQCVELERADVTKFSGSFNGSRL